MRRWTQLKSCTQNEVSVTSGLLYPNTGQSSSLLIFRFLKSRGWFQNLPFGLFNEEQITVYPTLLLLVKHLFRDFKHNPINFALLKVYSTSEVILVYIEGIDLHFWLNLSQKLGPVFIVTCKQKLIIQSGMTELELTLYF